MDLRLKSRAPRAVSPKPKSHETWHRPPTLEVAAI